MVKPRLSNREIQILLLVCNEHSAEEIGKKLNISIGTVYTHRKNLLAKTGARNKVGLVKYAIRNELI
ncbi:MAG TPA: helix-turn-helix transcriptional regulator [Bacteroidia bacterium]|nr:helix-turn-helix transcriptional regulator [Bacteroidia bacterium]